MYIFRSYSTDVSEPPLVIACSSSRFKGFLWGIEFSVDPVAVVSIDTICFVFSVISADCSIVCEMALFVPALTLNIVSDANGNTIKIVYNTSNGQPTTGANRIVRVVRYNSGYQTESSAETIATFTYDSYGNLTSIKDSIDRSTDFTYVGNLLTAVQYPDSQTIQYGYQYKTVNSQQIAFLSTAYDAESKYGIQYTRGSNWNP